jgi:hypothetical protein
MHAAHVTTTARTSIGTTAITGVGFQPKLWLPYGALRTTTGLGLASGFGEVFNGKEYDGAGTPRGARSIWAEDNVATSNVNGSFTALRALEILDAATPPVVAGQAQVSSWDSDGLTVNWTNAATSAWIVYGLALGGADLTNITTDVILVNTSAGVQNFNGYGYQPDFILAWGNANFYSFGMASGSAAGTQGCMFGVDVSGENPSSSRRTFSAGNLMGLYRTTGAAHPFTISQDMLASLNGFGADGFSINKSDAPASTRSFSVLLIKGGQHEVGVIAAPAATGQVTYTVSPNVRGVWFFSDCEPSGSTVENAQVAMGGGVPGATGTALYASEDNVSPTNVTQYAGTEAIVCGVDMSGPSITTAASLVSCTQGSFTLDWTSVSGNQEQLVYWAFGSTATAPPRQVIRYNRGLRVS